jgi:hypothetical protein
LKNVKLLNSKGISILFLVMAMMVMVSIGYIFSYLIPMKQESVRFPICSSQAFFIAQSGVEFAIRYGSNRGWRDTTALSGLNGMQGNIVVGKVNGKFTINYAPDTLTSTGVINNSSEKRIITVSNLTQFLNVLILDTTDSGTSVPCWCNNTRRVRFFIKYVGSNSITLTAFSATWQETIARRLTRIYMNGVQIYAAPGGQYYNGNPTQNFNAGGNSQTINAGQWIPVLVYWNNNISATNNIIIKFYTALGDPYTFTLNLTPPPGGSCAVGC